MNAPASIAITPIFVGDLLTGSERMPIYVHVIDHPDARVLVDTGLTDLHPAVADLDPRIRPLNTQHFHIASVDIVVNTHLHFDHCNGDVAVWFGELDDPKSDGQVQVCALGPAQVWLTHEHQPWQRRTGAQTPV